MERVARRGRAAALGLWLAACGGAGEGSKDAPATKPEPAAAAEAEVTKAGVGAGAPATGAAAKPAGPSEPTRPGEAAKPSGATKPSFHRALAADRPQLHALADGTVLASVGPQIFRVNEHGVLVPEPSLLEGMPPALSAGAGGEPYDWRWDIDVTGRWPDELFVSYWVAPPPNVPYVVRPTLRRRDGRFERMPLGADDHGVYYVDARPYVEGSLLSLVRHQALPPPGVGLTECHEDDAATLRKCEARFAAVRKKAESSKQLVVTRGEPQGPDLEALLGAERVLLHVFDSLPSGHVLAATDEERARMIVMTPTGGEVMALPGKPGEPLRIHAVRLVAADLAFAAGGEGREHDVLAPKLFRFDGRTWTEEPAPACGESAEIYAFEALASGERLAVCARAPEEDDGFPLEALPLQWQPPGGEWVALEQRAAALSLRGQHPWVADDDGVFTTEPVAKEQQAETRKALDAKLLKGAASLELDRTW